MLHTFVLQVVSASKIRTPESYKDANKSVAWI